MRLWRIRGGLDYYAARELDDEGVDRRAFVQLEREVASIRFRIKALDLTVAAPKSVSVAWALATGEDREALARAHERAVATLLGELTALEWSRPGRSGEELPLEQVASLAAHHHLSRAGDPHLHTHLVIANRGWVEGRPRAVDHWRLESHLPAYELLYRVALAAELARGGRRLEGVGLGQWRLAGQEPGLIELFSKRRHEVLAEAWSPSAQARSLAALRTRLPKAPEDLDRLRARWREEANGPLAIARADARAEWPRVGDPLLAECVRAIAEGVGAVPEAWELALGRALGAEAARDLLAGEEVRLGQHRLRRDGTLLAAYRQLPLEERIARAGGRYRPLEAPRSLHGLLEGLARAASRPGQRLELRGASVREEQLVAGLGQYRAGPRAPLVVIDANAIAPSELAALTRERGAMVRVDAPARDPGPGAVAVIPCENGGAMVVAERGDALWEAFVEAGAAALAAHGSQLVVPNEVLARRLRREIAASRPDLVVSSGSKLLKGELVRDPWGAIGRVMGARDGAVLVESQQEVVAYAPSQLVALGIVREGAQRAAGHVVSFGNGRGRFLAGDQVFVLQGGVEELVRSLGGHGRIEIPDAIHHELQSRRLWALARRDLPQARDELEELRALTRRLFTHYLLARELGLDERGGFERSLPALGIEERYFARAREESSRALRHEAALSW